MRTLAILAISAAFAAVVAPAAMASQASPGNPSGTGPPNQTCQVIEGLNNNVLPNTSAGSSPGAVFNEGFTAPDGTVTGQGKGGFQYNLVGAPSQYDVACFQTQFKLTSP